MGIQILGALAALAGRVLDFARLGGGLLAPALSGKIARAGGVAMIVLGAWFGVIRHYEKKGEIKLVQRSIEAGEAANVINDKIRNVAARPGAFERLRKSDCRDCR